MEEKRLSEFLKENGAYESFIENCLNDEDTLQYVVDYNLSNIGIFMGFIWKATSEGEDYWSKICDKLGELNIRYDMDEILYKEYEKRNMKESSEQNPITKDIVENDEEVKTESPLLTLNDLRDVGLSEKGLLENGYSEEDLRKEPYEEYLKRKFETNIGQYEVLFKEKKSNDWMFCYRPNDLSWGKDWDYKLIKKEHKEIFETYIKDRNIKIEFTNKVSKDININIEFTNKVSKDADIKTIWYVEEDLIENYYEEYTYRIVVKEFKPFTLNIEVNTVDEAKSLWNRFNLGYVSLCEAMQSEHYEVEFKNRLNEYKYWKQIDNLLKDLGEEPDVKR